MAYPQPRYDVEKRFGRCELRHYQPFCVAETEVDGDRIIAGNRGFRRLASYIFGNNLGEKKLAMTAPVTEAAVEPAAEHDGAAGAQGRERFVVQFMLPAGITPQNAPTPLDGRVRFRRVPARHVAALRYSGTWSERRYLRHVDELLHALAHAHLRPLGEPAWARYDAPYTPWFLRRNEVLVEVWPGVASPAEPEA